MQDMDVAGTLTANVMELKRVSIAGKLYNMQELKYNDAMSDATTIDTFFRILCMCHTVVVSEDSTGVRSYQAESPDEDALVKGAQQAGWVFMGSSFDSIDCTCQNTAVSVELLAVNEFNSIRKRQSILFKDACGVYKLYCKGADNIMLERSTGDHTMITEHLQNFSVEGLRTLVFAQRTLSEKEALEWLQSFKEASKSEDSKSKLMKVAEMIETDLEVVGVSAIEDKLQDGVPDTIVSLHQAGIKLWVLTGDKQETAINIGNSCGLLSPEMKLIIISSQQSLKATHTTVKKELENLFGEPGTALHAKVEPECLAMVVDGPTLRYILDYFKDEVSYETFQKTRGNFLKIARSCSVVIACRVSPAQKAQMVKLVKDGVTPKPNTLAIGDGANDVAMIQEAQLGVGILGKEGMQAVNASDFAIGQFRFLNRLLLIHGRWNYVRMSKVLLYSFYKNIVCTLTKFVYCGFTAWSGTTLYEDMVDAGFNFFLAMPIICVGMFDRDISEQFTLDHPQLYMSGRLNLHFNNKKMFQWILSSMAHTLVMCLVLNNFVKDEQEPGIYAIGTTVYTCVIFTMQYKVFFETNTWTFWNHFFFWGSFAFYFLVLVIYNLTPPELSFNFYNIFFMIMGVPFFWILSLTVPMACMLVDLFCEHVRKSLFPNVLDICQEIDAGLGYDKDASGHSRAITYNNMKSLVREQSGVLIQTQSSVALSSENHQPTSSPEVEIPTVKDRLNSFAFDHPDDGSDMSRYEHWEPLKAAVHLGGCSNLVRRTSSNLLGNTDVTNDMEMENAHTNGIRSTL